MCATCLAALGTTNSAIANGDASGSSGPTADWSAPTPTDRPAKHVQAVTYAAIAATMATWIAIGWLSSRRGRAWFNPRQITTIAALAAIRFAVSFTFLVASTALAVLLGPFQIFVSALGAELLGTAVMAAVVVLAPQVGAYMLASLTVALLNALVGGQLGLTDVLFVSVGSLVAELLLWPAGVTRLDAGVPLSARTLPDSNGGAAPACSATAHACRIALALGAANGIKLYVQYCIYETLYRLHFAGWYVAAVVLWTGVICGGLGAWLGAAWGRKLQRALP